MDQGQKMACQLTQLTSEKGLSECDVSLVARDLELVGYRELGMGTVLV